jgi:hypothetical protein
MEQQLLHWSDVSAKTSAHPQGRSFFYPVHVRLDISADRVRAVFFRTMEDTGVEPKEELVVQEPVRLDELIANSDGFPVSHYSPTDDRWSGAYLDPALADINIGLLGTATLYRTEGYLGSAERDGPGIYVFALNDQGIPMAPFNVYSQSYRSKRDPRFTRVMTDQTWPVMVAVPCTGAAFDECSFLVRNSSQCHFSSNLEGWTQLTQAPPTGVLALSLPTLQVSSPTLSMSPNSSATVDVRVLDCDGVLYPHGEQTIFLEETGGLLPLRRIRSIGGLASFRISSVGMQSGESFRVKLGFRNISGCDEVAVSVL